MGKLIPRTFEIGKVFLYSKEHLAKDLIAGLTVGIVALLLAKAFSIAAGGSPAQGLYTAYRYFRSPDAAGQPGDYPCYSAGPPPVSKDFCRCGGSYPGALGMCCSFASGGHHWLPLWRYPIHAAGTLDSGFPLEHPVSGVSRCIYHCALGGHRISVVGGGRRWHDRRPA